MRLALLGAAVLVLAGAAAFYYAARGNGQADAQGATQVAVTAGACEPNALTVEAGERRFQIVNKSDRPVEWEILDGVMVVEERENIAPGFSQTLSTRLQPGDYQMTCGLLSNPRGTLHVTASADASAAPGAPTVKSFIGPLSEYKVYLVMQGRRAVKAAAALQEAIKAGDLEKAKSLYEPARLPYKRIEPVAARFADLQSAIAPQAAYLEKREADPAFTGYHRIEYGLFGQKSLDGLEDPAAKLVEDVTKLKDRLHDLKLTPGLMLESASHLAEQLGGQAEAGSEHYAHDDLDGIAANLEGVRKVVSLLAPVLKASASQAVGNVETSLDALDKDLSALGKPGSFPLYDKVDAKARAALAADFRKLARAIGELAPAAGTG